MPDGSLVPSKQNANVCLSGHTLFLAAFNMISSEKNKKTFALALPPLAWSFRPRTTLLKVPSFVSKMKHMKNVVVEMEKMNKTGKLMSLDLLF